MAFQYDIFISYSRADQDWAQKLKSSLAKLDPPRTAFFDNASLRAGDDWEANIQAALENSQNLIVLWSENAKLSDWVTRELWTFFATAKPKANNDRRLICLNLEGMNQATRTYQQISHTGLQEAYKQRSVPAADDWTSVMADVRDGLDPERRAISVPLVVLTVTRQELEDLAPDRWTRIEKDFEITRVELLPWYGASREDWRPFAGNESVNAVLDQLRTEINGALSKYRIHWNTCDAAFWSNIANAKKLVQSEFETGELSVLVIDPVALYHPDVYQRLMLFQDTFASNRRVILSLPPFATPRSLLRLRDALVNSAMPYFDDYFQPSVPPKRALAAFCGWNAADKEDIRRLLLAAVGQFVYEASAGARVGGSTFLRHGAAP